MLAELDQRLADDQRFAGGRILGSMCSQPHDVARLAFERYLEANIGDEGLVPGLALLEREAVALLGQWWGRPEASGRLVTGGTEANLLALWTARALAGPDRTELVVPASAHYSFDKAASLMGLRLLKVPTDDLGRVRVELVEQALGRRTLAVVGVAGSTAWGAVDDVVALADVARRHGVYFHLDASFGGFVLPFLGRSSWPEGLSSLSADPHKMGRGPIPSGMLLWKDEATAQAASVEVGYLSGGRLRQNTVVGTRSGAAVAGVWAVMHHLGWSGYRQVVDTAMALTEELTQRLGHVPGVQPALEHPETNVVAVRGLNVPAPELVERLRRRGWSLSSWSQTFRIVLMPHVTRAILNEFLIDLEEVAR